MENVSVPKADIKKIHEEIQNLNQNIIELKGAREQLSKDRAEKQQQLEKIKQSIAKKICQDNERTALQQEQARLKVEHESAMDSFLQLGGKEKFLFNLHQGTAVGALDTISKNYTLTFQQASYNPSKDDLILDSDTVLRKAGDAFSYELKNTVYGVRVDKEKNNMLVKKNGQLQKISTAQNLNLEQLKKEGYEPIFEFSSIAKVDLTKETGPVASYEVQVESYTDALQYKGPTQDKDTTVSQLNNISKLWRSGIRRTMTHQYDDNKLPSLDNQKPKLKISQHRPVRRF